MAVKLNDTRNPMLVGHEVFRKMLEGYDVEADAVALSHALHDAANHAAERWVWLADRMSAAVDSVDDVVVGRQVIDARQDVTRATELAHSLLAALRSNAAVDAAEHEFGCEAR